MASGPSSTGQPDATGAVSSGLGLSAVNPYLAIFSTIENLRLSSIQSELTQTLAGISKRGAQAGLAALKGGDATYSTRKPTWDEALNKIPELIGKGMTREEAETELGIRSKITDGGLGLADLSRRKLDRKGEEFEAAFGADKENLGVQKQRFEISRLRQKSQLALEQGNTRLAKAEASKAARLESEQFRKNAAAGGYSAFSRARGQLSINKVAPIEQRMTALQREGLLASQEAGIIKTQFESVEKRLQEAYARGTEEISDAKQELEINLKLQEEELKGRIEAADAQKKAAEDADKILGFIPNPGGLI